MKRRILALLLAVCLVFQATPVFADAAQGQRVAAGDVTVTAGNTASVTLQAENFESIATFELYIYYDPAAFTVSSTSNGSLLSGSQASVNTTEAGTIKLAAMSLNGISGSGSLLTVRFSTTTATAAGTYPITVAVGNAYGADLQEATIQSQSGSITVKERVESEYFNIHGERSASTLQKDDTLSYRVYNSSSRSFVTGEFTFTYDHELFAFDSATLGSGLTGEGAVWSVNSSVLGQVRIAYANDTAVNAYQLFTVKLKVIADTDTTTTVKATAANMYRADLSTYLSGSCSSSMSLKKLQVNDYPNVWLETSRLIVGQPASSIFYLEKGAGVAAADFTLTYDPAVLRCTGVTVCDTVAGQNGMVIINENFGNGTVRFSYINMDAYGDETLSLVRIAWEPLQSPKNHYQLCAGGVGVVDADQKAIPLEYLTDSGCIFVRTVVPPLCLVDGYTDHVCACGENYQTDVVEKLGHDIHQFPPQAVSCTEVGWDAYEGCSRCDYGTYAEIPALGHAEIAHEAREVTCTEIGWDPYVTCSRCDYTTYEEIPPLGHRVIVPMQIPTDPIGVTNHTAYPFSLEDGTYYSTNHNHSSFSKILFTAKYACDVTVHYGVSSENNCDLIRVRRNNSVLFNNSGEVTGTRTVSLNAGDTLSLEYQKDSSVNTGQDRGWIRLEYDYVLVDGYGDVPAETLEPDCVNAVVCSYCDAVIKEALGHDEIPHESKAPTCLEIGWEEYVTCSRCDYTTYMEIPALGHDEITHEAQAQTCLGVGWDTYVTCSRCDYTTYQELPALGHRVYMDRPGLVDPLEIKNDGALPFEVIDGVYYSQNHTDSSSTEFTVTALYDCKVTLIYSVSSETNYDKLFLLRNGSQLTMISGTVKNKRMTLDLSAGEVLTVRYSKDGSAANGDDRGWIRFEYEWVMQNVSTLVPAEEADPTCTEPVICSVCGDQAKPPLGHDAVLHEAKAPTCIQAGWEAYTGCSRCDYGRIVEIPALGHDEIAHEGKEPTCLEGGWADYVTCSRCDYSTYTALSALGHRVVGEVIKWTSPLEVQKCVNFTLFEGSETYVSTNFTQGSVAEYSVKALYDCQPQIAFGNLEEESENIISVFKNGEELATVVGVGDQTMQLQLTAGDVLTFRFVKNGSGTGEMDVGAFILQCEDVPLGYEDVPAQDQEPDCTNSVVCHYCGVTVKAALGHDNVSYEGKTVTCLEHGWESYTTCNRCGYSTYQEIPALGHDEIAHGGKEPACLEGGWADYVTCSRCDYSTYTALSARGHRVTVEVTEPLDPLSIENEGFYFDEAEALYVCYNEAECAATALYNCKLILYYGMAEDTGMDRLVVTLNGVQLDGISIYGENTVELDLLAGDVLVIRFEKNGGADEGIGVFKLVYNILTEGYVDALAHILEPTCTEAVVCSYCNTTVKEALGHDEVAHEGKAPVCEEGGWESYVTCNRCDYTTYKALPALGHDYYFYEPIPPTCTQDGVETSGGCTRCDTVVHVNAPALGHDLIDHAAQAPSCTEVGWNAYETCSRCDYTTYQELPATGHAYGQWIQDIAPTCQTQGRERRNCASCAHFETRDVAALGHNLQNHEAQAVTCAAIGWEAYETCSRCDYTTYVEIPALGHEWTAKVQSDATLRAAGENCTQAYTYWDSCCRCHAISDTSFFEGLATGPHHFTEELKDDAHRVPGTEDPAWYYYDCAYCDVMGEESFSDILKGDMDGDGGVDEDDAIYLLQSVLMPDFFPLNQVGDMDGNGTVDEDDAIYLLQHVLMPDYFPL